MSQVMTITLPKLHSAQWEIMSDPHRFKVAACGRRFGKTEGASLAGTEAALKGQVVWWIAPTYRVTKYGWDAFCRIARQIPGCVIKEAARQIHYPTGGSVEVRTGIDPDALRGAGLDLAILDEAAFLSPAVWSEAIRPALADRRGKAMFLSTPNGKNWFWGLWRLGQDPLRREWKSWKFPTTANPYISPDEVESARELLPERVFSQEYLAEFLEDKGAVFRGVEELAVIEPGQGPVNGHRYVFGVDWAKDADFTSITIVDTTEQAVVWVDRFNEIGWSVQRGRLIALFERWRPFVIVAEANSVGGPNIEALQADGLPVMPFVTTAQSKGPLIESLALAIERKEIRLLNDPVLITELQAYTMTRLPSGRFTYSAPSGQNDDTVISTALAWDGRDRGGGIYFA